MTMMDDAPFGARLELEQRRNAAAQRVRTGALLLAHVPVGLVLATVISQFPGELALVAALMIGAASVVVAPILGLSMIVGGGCEHRRLVRDAVPGLLLPAARVVERRH